LLKKISFSFPNREKTCRFNCRLWPYERWETLNFI